MIPNFGNGMELRRHIFLDGGVWLIFANKERDTFIFHMQEDEYLVFSTTGQRGFGNHGSDVHDSVSRPFRAGPDSDQDGGPFDFGGQARIFRLGWTLVICIVAWRTDI